MSDSAKEKSILVIAGPDDGGASECVALVKKLNLENKVFVIGKLIGDEKWEILKQSDVLVVPTPDQAFPLVLLEALSQNTPVVTSEIVLKNKLPEELGAVVNLQLDEFAKALEWFVAKEDKPTTGYDFVKENYSTPKYTARIEEIYLNLISK